jgi:hypothetical protein
LSKADAPGAAGREADQYRSPFLERGHPGNGSEADTYSVSVVATDDGPARAFPGR